MPGSSGLSLGCPSAWEGGILGLISRVARDTWAQKGKAAQGSGWVGHQGEGRGSHSPQSDQSLLGKTPSHRDTGDPGIWACRKGASCQVQGPPAGSSPSPFSACSAGLCLVPRRAHGWAATSTLDVTGGQDRQKDPSAPSRLLPWPRMALRASRLEHHPSLCGCLWGLHAHLWLGVQILPAPLVLGQLALTLMKPPLSQLAVCSMGTRFQDPQAPPPTNSEPGFTPGSTLKSSPSSVGDTSLRTLGSVAGTCPPREQRRDGGGGGWGAGTGEGDIPQQEQARRLCGIPDAALAQAWSCGDRLPLPGLTASLGGRWPLRDGGSALRPGRLMAFLGARPAPRSDAAPDPGASPRASQSRGPW